MNPTEIYDALDQIATAPFDPVEFPFTFAEATDNAKATISKLRNGSTNKSDIAGGVLLNRRFHYAPAFRGGVEAVLDRLRASKRSASAKPAILLATDGEEVAAEHLASGDPLHCRFDEIGDKFGFFLPAAGKERYEAVEENPIDVKATGKLAKLYDALIKANPEWGHDTHRHATNQLMMRLIFCLFAEDVGIFPEGQFSRLLFTHAGDHGEEAREVIVAAFGAMNRPKDARVGLPAWTAELEYVNGGLFAGEIDAPRFDPIAFRYLRDACRLNWREINPDIFGSMIQSVADPKQRSELGMHYTSVPNIMKVLGPLFLDDLDADIGKAWEKPRALQRALDRMAGIRVFDPACGSGNFLVVAYRELRGRETRILARIAEIEGRAQTLMFSAIPITHFYGIEIADFAAETAKLALFIGEYQANAKFGEVFGQMPASLPLKESARIVCGNSLRTPWEDVCPAPKEGEEVFILGNPPYLGAKKRDDWQTDDMIANGLDDLLLLDYVSTWFFRAESYGSGKVPFAFVATSSICQGEQVAPMWTRLLRTGLRIRFAYRPFIWRSSAADNAGVWVTIVGLDARSLPEARLFDGEVVTSGRDVSPYLILDRFIPVGAAARTVFDLPEMVMGSNPVDGKRLSVTTAERAAMLAEDPRSGHFIMLYLGGDELIEDAERYCLWIEDDELDQARAIRPIEARINACRAYRMNAGRDARKVAETPHRFCYSTYRNETALAIPNSQSSEREYVPAVMVQAGTVLSKEAFAIYSPPGHTLALVSSRLHRLWLASVGGRIGNGFRYSVKLVYNTFPVPNFTDAQKEQLSASARRILKTRYGHYPKTIAELYDPDNMPDDLRAAHKANDELLEAMYIGRPFRNDTERLEKLFKLYAARVKQEG